MTTTTQPAADPFDILVADLVQLHDTANEHAATAIDFIDASLTTYFFDETEAAVAATRETVRACRSFWATKHLLRLAARRQLARREYDGPGDYDPSFTHEM